MRVANLISFSWTSLRLDLYSFSSSVSCFFSFSVSSLVLGLVLEFLDLLALVDDGLDDVVAQRAPALDALHGGHRLGVVEDAAQGVVVHVHEQRALPLARQQRGRGARHRDVEDAARVDLRHVRAVVGQHGQERHEVLDRVLRVRLVGREADPVLGELPQRARGREVEHEADGLEDLLLVRVVAVRVLDGPRRLHAERGLKVGLRATSDCAASGWMTTAARSRRW